MKFFTILSLIFFTILTNAIHASCKIDECTSSCEKTTQYGRYVELIGGLGSINLRHSKTDFNPGYNLGGIVGYKFSNNFRLELEASYQRSEIQSARFLSHVNGHARSWCYMFNVLVDIDLKIPNMTFYLGSGIGYATVKGKWSGETSWADMDYFFTGDRSTTYTTLRKGCAYQGICGIKYFICQGLEAAIDYRNILIDWKHNEAHKVSIALIRYF